MKKANTSPLKTENKSKEKSKKNEPNPNLLSPSLNLSKKQNRSKSNLKKHELDVIAQKEQNKGQYDRSQFFTQSIKFAEQSQNLDVINEQGKGPSFERSMKLSQKRYNVSLASASQKKSTQQPSRQSILKSTKSRSRTPPQQKQTLSPTKKNNRSMSRINPLNAQHQNYQWLTQQLKTIKNESIKNIDEEFRKQIEDPLKIQRQMKKSSATTRCLHHNTQLSLYCCIDRQLLCVGCIYSQKNHKTHRIVPIIKSQKQMKQDIQSFKNRIQSTVQQTQNLIRQSSLNMIRIEKQYPAILHQIETYYFQIHELIEQKKNQQLQYVETIRNQLKTEYKAIGHLLNRINNSFSKELKDLAVLSRSIAMTPKGQKDDKPDQIPQQKINQLIQSRCTYEILARFHKILNKNSDQLFDEKRGFDLKIDNFQQVLKLIEYKLTMVIPITKKQFLQGSRKKGFTNLFLQPNKQFLNINNTNPKQNAEKDEQQAQDIQKDVTPNKANDSKSPNKKGFSTSPQVPKGLSRRFL